MDKEPKFCKNCKYIVPCDTFSDLKRKFENAGCGKTKYTNLVTGETEYKMCATQRSLPLTLAPDACGENGRFYEPAA